MLLLASGFWEFVLPENWDGFTATRHYRSIRYDITVKREGAGNVVSLMVDGQPVDGDMIPLSEGKDRVEVIVTIR